jgi:hypothetical protein
MERLRMNSSQRTYFQSLTARAAEPMWLPVGVPAAPEVEPADPDRVPEARNRCLRGVAFALVLEFGVVAIIWAIVSLIRDL